MGTPLESLRHEVAQRSRQVLVLETSCFPTSSASLLSVGAPTLRVSSWQCSRSQLFSLSENQRHQEEAESPVH